MMRWSRRLEWHAGTGGLLSEIRAIRTQLDDLQASLAAFEKRLRAQRNPGDQSGGLRHDER